MSKEELIKKLKEIEDGKEFNYNLLIIKRISHKLYLYTKSDTIKKELALIPYIGHSCYDPYYEELAKFIMELSV